MRRLIILVGVALMGACLMPVSAAADPIDCVRENPRTGQCVIFVQPPPPDYGPPPGWEPGDPDPGEAVCYDQIMGQEIPCIVGGYWYWSASWECYTALADPQPDWSDAVWGGRTDGAIYYCARGVLPDDPLPPSDTILRWSPTPPWGSAPDPEDLAREAIASMDLRAIDIGIVPEPRPGSVGIIGLPTYMWVASPTGHTWGPITRTASSGPFSVTATAAVDRIEWDMGDGTVVTCATAGTPYRDVYGSNPSPDCGHYYEADGEYTVTATSYWVVEWSGLGQSGTIELDFSDSSGITMGEVQVITGRG